MTVYNSSIQPATKKICSNDASHTTSRWLKDPNDKARDLCKSCYKTALAKKQTADGRVCSNDASHSTKQWVKDPNDKTRDLCRSCYEAAIARKQKAVGKVCSNDASHKASRWKKDPNDKTRDLCENCYKPALAQKQQAEGRVCSNDASHATTQWHKDPKDKTRDICRSCYDAALAQKHKAKGRVCSNDASHTTKQWRKDPNDKTRDFCRSCYDTALAKKQQTDKKRKREEPNLGSSKDVASQSVSEATLKRRRVEDEVSPILSTSDLSLVENQRSSTAEIIEQASLYGDVEHLFLPSLHDSSIFPITNALLTEFMGEIPDPGVTDGQSFQASAHRVRENRQSSADMGSGLFGFPGGWNDSSSIATTHEQLPGIVHSYSYVLSDNYSSINQTSLNYLPDNHHDSL